MPLVGRTGVRNSKGLTCYHVANPEASDWLRAIPDPKFKKAISGALWNTMISLRLLIPIDTFCSYCADAGTPGTC